MLLGLASLVACGGGSLDDARFPTGSQTLAASSDYRAVYSVNTDEGTISRVDVASGQVTEIAVGAEPTRIARAGDRVYVTLRGERGIAVLRESGDSLTLEELLSTGAEPVGIVASESGDRIFVAASQSGFVQEIDTATHEVVREWPVAHEPRWLALHPSGNALYVGSALEGRLTWLDLRGTSIITVPLPPLMRMVFSDGGEQDGRETEVVLTPRITGDLAVSPDGTSLLTPAVYVDNTTPVGEPDPDNVTQDGYGASPGVGLSRFNPAIVEVPLSAGGRPKADDGHALLLAGFADFNVQDNGGGRDAMVVRSYPTSVTVSPNGMVYLATMEGSRTVVAVSRQPFERTFVDERVGDFSDHARSFVVTDHGPRGLAFVGDDRAVVHSFLDRSVAELRYPRVEDSVRQQATGENSEFNFLHSFTTEPSVRVARSALPADVEAGRRLFFAAADGRMSVSGSGVSCATCHTDGRNDGLTWAFVTGDRQTPSLAGRVSLTEPVTWTANVPSVAQEVLITSQGRMGGHGLAGDEARQVSAFIDWTRDVDLPLKGSSDPGVLRGKALFERSDVGCATCHSGQAYTDNESHALLGLPNVNTPTLVGVAATAPYFHDGSAKTLRDVLEQSKVNGMGNTGSLSDSELSDLESYLRSL